jgi:hypothetical protein
MGKVILEFDSIEEAEDIRDAINGHKYKYILWDLDQHCRSKMKYVELKENEYEVYESIRETIREFLNDAGLSIND